MAAGFAGADRGDAVPVCVRANGGCAPGPLLAVTLGGSVAPETLPRRRFAPSVLSLFFLVQTADGSHPSALREAELRIDRDVEFDAMGLPACGYRKLAADRVVRACRRAIVGSGEAEVASADGASPLTAGIALFNGGVRDGAVILFARMRSPEGALIARIEIRRARMGDSGWVARTVLPQISAGDGSLVRLEVKLGRNFFRRGGRASFVSARCRDGRLSFEATKSVFRNEVNAPGVAPQTIIKGGFIAPCTPTP